jgi:hypothetical protein
MQPVVVVLATGVCATLAACGSSTPVPASAAAATTAPLATPAPAPITSGQSAAACQATSARELDDIARRIYAQAVNGRNVQSSVRRLTHSRALGDAVARGDAHDVRVALRPLLKNQVVRLEVFGAHRRLVSLGTKSSFAPVRAELAGPGRRRAGHLLLAVSDDRAYIGITRRLTGVHVLFHRGGTRVMGSLRAMPARLPAEGTTHVGGTAYRATTIAATAFPSGRLAISVLAPAAPAGVCGTDAADTRLRTIGAVGRRLFAQEQNSSTVQRTLRYAAADPAFRRAAASGDPVALRAAVVGFFRNHRFHIVRVRLTKGARVVYDLGGPYVLAPASRGVAGPDGRPAGRFTLAVQDDTGYIKLMHRFTGAAVQLRTPAGQVPGSTLAPGPAVLPAHAAVRYHGATYGVDSFTAVTFPSGPLQISLLVRRSP